MLGIMAGWFITIYDALYTSESAYETLKQFDDLYSTVMSNATFKSVSSIMTGIGMSIMLLYFFADLADRVSARRLTTEQLIPPFIKMVFAVFLINNGLNIIGYLVSFGTSLAADMTDEASGATLSEFFSNSDNLSAFKKGLNKIEAKKAVVYIVESIIPYILSFGTKIIVIFIGISRLVELTVRVIFAPFAVADVYQKGSNSGGMRYLRKIFALILQFAAIVGIYIACASIISSLNISSNGADMYETLTGSTEESVYTYAGYSSTVTITSISKNACITFLDSLFGGSGNYWLCMGVLLARIGLVIKSQQIANDIAGV